jgi:hypothetical protein
VDLSFYRLGELKNIECRDARNGFRRTRQQRSLVSLLMAFEHYDSGRSHLFAQANFHGSFAQGGNVVSARVSPDDYLTPYNVVYLSADAMFVYGGGYGDKGGIGAFVARVDPKTLKTVWTNQLINTVGPTSGTIRA